MQPNPTSIDADAHGRADQGGKRGGVGAEAGLLIPVRSERPRLFALAVACIFVIVGLLWIWGSDKVLRWLALPPEVAQAVEVWKGTCYVVVTSIILYLLIARPLTRLVRSQAQAAGALRDLDRNQQILEQAQLLGQIGSWVSDPAQQGKLEWSRETYRIFGIEEGGFDGALETFFSMVHPEDRAAVRSASMAALAGKAEYAIDHRIVRPDGGVRWVHERARVERDAAGVPARMIGVCQDITERREAEGRLRESEQRLALLVHQSPLAVIVWDLDFAVTEWNRAAEQIFGWSAGEALGRQADFILPESVKPHVADVWAALMRNAGGSRSTNANVTREGRSIYCEWYNAPLVDAGGRVLGVASIVDDVTERRMAEQRQQRMTAELDHRVRNNLAAVISLAEQSGRAASDYAEFRVSYLGRVRALTRLHNALAASRWQGADLGTMVVQTLEAFGQDTTSKAMVHGPRVVLPARAAQAMGMALNELCTNAIKYGALSVPGGRVEVRWSIHTPVAGDPAAQQVLELSWVECDGPRVAPPTRRGFGTELIEGAINYELGGSAVLTFDPQGLRATLRVELPPDTELDPCEGQRPGGT